MIGKMDSRVITTTAIMGLMMIPVTSHSRVNSLTGGIGTFYDYSDQNYDSGRSSSDTYSRIGLRPMINFSSTGEKDSFLLKASPSIKYDLEESETDWDSNLSVAADRFINKSWQVNFSDTYIRSDYYDQGTNSASQPVDPTSGVVEVSNPTLSTDLGRRQYWTNTLNVGSNYFYQQDSYVRAGFNYNVLRNDQSGIDGYDDYDRYVVNLADVHRFSPRWRTTADFNYVIGNYDNLVDSTTILSNDQLSQDLNEYRLLLSVDNNSITHNPLSLYYNYIDTDYDEPLRSDVYIHQMRATWTKEFSPHLYTKLGAGPSYGKSEGNDAQWGYNGVAELNYLIEHGFVNFKVDKRYDIQNFSGNYERGAVDTWNSTLSFQYLLLQDLRASGSLAYINEDHKYQFSDTGNLPDSYQKDRYIAGVGLGYNFWQNYTMGIDYTYINQDSDQIDDSYDEHRVLLTLSWQKELYRW